MKEAFVFYICIVFVISVFLTVYDKINAKMGRRRVSEKTLLTYAAIGGAASMYITMLLIRHKTRHMKFMLLLPLFICLHIAFLYAVIGYF